MARIRTIKPEFFSSEDIVSLSPLARILYVALWCEADREGRLVWKPATFKLRYLPGDSCDVHALCDEILARGLVRLYGDGYALIPSFGAHQHINPRETSSQLPAPADDFQAPPVSGTRQPRVGTRETRESDAQGGREGKGKEGENDASRRASVEPSGFSRFWSTWPSNDRKQAKGKCLEAWKKAGAEKEVDSICAHVDHLKGSEEWQRQGGQFIPAPLVYLNQRRWEGADMTAASAGAELGPYV
ncbi:MAG: hypothetical protein EKK45_00775 [Curvibacter sp.]|nr:MAG: hypothetical protein EKK45_00775 [Curvibacter sp.]